MDTSAFTNNTNTFNSQGGTGGQQYDWLSSFLKNSSANGMPYKQDMLNTATRGIQENVASGLDQVQTSLSQRGLGRGGISVGARANVTNAGNKAINQATSQVNQEDMQFRMNAIKELLGLNTQQAKNNLGQLEDQNQTQLGISKLQQQESEYNTDRSDKMWGAVGGMLGSLGSAGINYLMKPDKTQLNPLQDLG